MVSTVDITAHTMTVTRNGKVIRVIPITTGKAGFQTRGGIKVIMNKERYPVMDSTTVDIPADSPDAYHLKVEYALRLTWSGEFVARGAVVGRPTRGTRTSATAAPA